MNVVRRYHIKQQDTPGMWLFFGLFLVFIFSAIFVFLHRQKRRLYPAFGRRKVTDLRATGGRFPKKPAWVAKEIVRMKALMPEAGCRSLADSFNRRFADRGMTVGKTYVSDTVRKHRSEIMLLRKRLKHRPPKPMALNKVWAMDLTGKADASGRLHPILGLVELRKSLFAGIENQGGSVQNSVSFL